MIEVYIFIFTQILTFVNLYFIIKFLLNEWINGSI